MSSPSWLSTQRPYPGLRPFAFEDHEFFFGRQQQCGALYLMLDYSRFLAVLGSSGSGKSSMVRAGLLPLLAAERDAARAPGGTGRDWCCAKMQPGNAPLSHLAQAIAGFSEGHGGNGSDSPIIDAVLRDRVLFALTRSSLGVAEALEMLAGSKSRDFLILVDQFEEIFRYSLNGGAGDSADERRRDEATQFVQLLLEASRNREWRVHILVTMRSDFIGDCAQFHGLPEAVSSSQYLVPAMTRDQREEAIRGPLERAGAAIEPVLLERLLNDSGTELDQLPVLQHCLSRLWAQAREEKGDNDVRTLRLAHYQAIGGIESALSRHAEEVLQSLPGLEGAVEQTFRALSEIDDEGRATRRALRFDRLLAETGILEADLRRVLDQFRADDCSFLVPSGAQVARLASDSQIDVGHESLLRRWERISANERLTVGNGPGPGFGWLRAEARDGATYRALLSLLEHSTSRHAVVLPLDQVKRRLAWWRSRPRTAAWAERYGGQIERVEALFRDSRRHRAAIAAAFAGILLTAAVGFSLYYEWLVRAESRATTDRAMLLNEMTAMASDVSTNLRFTPSAGEGIEPMLDELKDFGAAYSNRLRRSGRPLGLVTGAGTMVNTRVTATVKMLDSDWQVNIGNIHGAVALLDRATTLLGRLPAGRHATEGDDGGWPRRIEDWIVPRPASQPTDWLPVLEADILVRRSLAMRLSGQFGRAAADLGHAESILDGTLARVGAAAARPCERVSDSELAEAASQRLAQLYSSRIDLDLHYRVDVPEAQRDLQSLRDLVTRRSGIEGSTENVGNGGDCAQPARRFWKAQADYAVPTLTADLLMGEANYDAAVHGYTDLVKSYDAVVKSDPGNIIASVKSRFYRYRLGQALLLRGKGPDLDAAVGDLSAAAKYYAALERRDDNAWWRIVDARVERTLGVAAFQRRRFELSKAAFSAAMRDDRVLHGRDRDDGLFRADLAQDQQDLQDLVGGRFPLEKTLLVRVLNSTNR